jgi:RHH-type proline utilization regulon transcriptional repressor/proline dehydrogenase/delta 1-pyrroline-5-carboxylate dehydrogenase
VAGNLYINRTITGAIVRRQPFGGCKESSFGAGAKAGGPNYILQLMQPKVLGYPTKREPVADAVVELDRLVKQADMSDAEKESWTAAIGSYAYDWNHYFSKRHDPSQVHGQNNFFYYVPRKRLIVRIQENDGWLDVLKAVAASLTCGTDMELSVSPEYLHVDQIKTFKIPLVLKVESDEEFLNRARNEKEIRTRFLSSLNANLQSGLADSGCHMILAPVIENGRLELLHYLREVSLSCDYHRYGYI